MSTDNNKAHSPSKASSKKSRFPSFLIGFLCALVVFLVIVILILSRNGERPVDNAVMPSARATKLLEIDPNAGAKVTPTPLPSVKIPGWLNLSIPKNAAEAPAAFYNPTENDGLYYLTFELTLTETGETIFVTGLIPPGQYCNLVKLNRPLEEGSYPAVLHVQPYYMDSLGETNAANMEITLTVE